MGAKSSFLQNIQKILVLYVIVWTISPPLQLDMIYRLAALGALGLWFLLNLTQEVQYEKIHGLTIVFALLVVVVALLESEGNFEAILRPITYYLLVIAFLMAYAYKERWDELSGLIPIVLLLLVFFNLKTYQAVMNDPTIARLIVRNDPSIYHYMRQGVGGYGLLYSQVCILPIIVFWTINSFKKSRIRFAIGVLWLISFTVCLLNSGYSIAVVTSIIGLIILFFYRRSSIVLAVVVTTVLLALLVWLIGYNDGFRNALLGFFDGTTVAKKINDIYLSITTTDAADSIMVRVERYQAALNTIITFPFIGGLCFSSGGGHSVILDTFAKYGLFGGYIFVKIIFDFPMKLKKSPQLEKDIRIANAIFIAVLMITLLNSVTYNFVCLILLVTPICYNDILNWRKKDEHSLDGQSAPEGSLAAVKH